MNRRVGQLTVIIVGILAATLVWADIPEGSFDFPTATSVKKTVTRANRESKPRTRKPSPVARATQQSAPHKVVKQKQPSRSLAEKQPEQKKVAAMTPPSPEKTFEAGSSAAYSHYLPKLKQGVNTAWGTVKKQGIVIQSKTLKTWQRVKRWVDTKKENLHVS